MHRFWPILFGTVLLASAGLFVVAPFVKGWWLPENVCSYGHSIHHLFYLILGFTGFFFVLTEAILVYAMWRFAADPARKSQYIHGSHRLEVVWTIVPAVILLFIAFIQVPVWAKAKYLDDAWARLKGASRSDVHAPDQVFEVTARQFEWRMRYPTAEQNRLMTEAWKAKGHEPEIAWSWQESHHADDIHRINEVHTWKGATVRIYLKSRDVIHSFFLPNMCVKQDAMPGKIIEVMWDTEQSNTTWDSSTQTLVVAPDRRWELACTELCGWGHFKMRGRVYVHESKEEYERWLAQAAQEQQRTQP